MTSYRPGPRVLCNMLYAVELISFKQQPSQNHNTTRILLFQNNLTVRAKWLIEVQAEVPQVQEVEGNNMHRHFGSSCIGIFCRKCTRVHIGIQLYRFLVLFWVPPLMHRHFQARNFLMYRLHRHFVSHVPVASAFL